jgi:hypothetical protein
VTARQTVPLFDFGAQILENALDLLEIEARWD